MREMKIRDFAVRPTRKMASTLPVDGRRQDYGYGGGGDGGNGLAATGWSGWWLIALKEQMRDENERHQLLREMFTK
jgi:hypothetical protein